MSPGEAYDLALENGPSKELEKVIAAPNSFYAYEYALNVLMGPFPEGEETISQDPYESLHYATNILKGPFPVGEGTLASERHIAYWYAKDALKGPFPAGEKTIATDARYSYQYARDVLNGPFPAGEAAIAKDSYFSYRYAIDVLKGPFTAGETSIINRNYSHKIHRFITDYKMLFANKADYQFKFNREICSIRTIQKFPALALAYAIMKNCRFPKGEPAMKKSPRIWKRYQEFINDSL